MRVAQPVETPQHPPAATETRSLTTRSPRIAIARPVSTVTVPTGLPAPQPHVNQRHVLDRGVRYPSGARTPREAVVSSIDIFVPAAVVAGCVLIMLVVWFVRRERTPRWSIEQAVHDPDLTLDIEPTRLADWHRAHGGAVATWIAAHEQVLRRLGDAELAVDLTDASLFEASTRAADGLQVALGQHPVPVMRAELSAMQVAGEATLHAVRRADYATAERQHVTYTGYRDEWVARLRQFSLDDPTLVELRRTLTPGDAVTNLTESPRPDDDTDSHADEVDPGVDDLRLSS